MGTLHNSPLNDLKVTLKHSTLVFPPQEIEKRSMFLSNIDQALNFNVQTIHFFPANPDFPPEIVAERLKSALSKLLVHYDHLAGRLKLNPESGRLEIDCNGAGAGFVVATSEFSLEEIGDLVYPNPGFRKLVAKSLDNLGTEDHPLCILQVTSFSCGGFVMGVSTNHAIFDGISCKTFLENLASQAADKPLAITPCNDRRLLAARSPPRVTFPHPELFKIPHNDQKDPDTPPPSIFDCPNEDLDFKIFHLSSDDITNLKEKVKSGPCVSTAKVTGFNVVTAHIWRCKALSLGGDSGRLSTVLYAVDIRPRLDPPLSRSYSGNAVLSSYATARCDELEEGPLSRLVEKVTEGSTRMTNEYARSAIDWGEVYKGFPCGEFLISSWWRLGFADVEYPWWKPRYSCPVVDHRKDIILLFPDIDGGVNKDGVNVLVSLPAKEMEKFQVLFHRFLA